MRPIFLYVFFTHIIAKSRFAWEEHERALYDMIDRVLPEIRSKIRFEFGTHAQENHTGPRLNPLCVEVEAVDVEELLAKTDQCFGASYIKIKSGRVDLLSVGLNHYFTTALHRSISWTGDNMPSLSTTAVLPSGEWVKCRTTEYTYYGNVCTSSYSHAWWTWKEWEKELDFLSLQGVNLLLSFTGAEYVLAEVLKSFGASNGDLLNFFPGPAFLAWFRMGNLRKFGGGLSQSWLRGQYELQLLILKRARLLGMKCVLPAFNSYVPESFVSLFPDVKFGRASNWWGADDQFCCLYNIDPQEPLFHRLGTAYLQGLIEHFGTDHFYQVDQFNEMLPPQTTNAWLQANSNAMYRYMIAADPEAIWLMQGWLFTAERFWTVDRIRSYLGGVPDKHMIILDLFSEQWYFWKKTNYYFGKSFIWNTLHNFGGNGGLSGQVGDMFKLSREAVSGVGSTMIGYGVTMEGISQNSIIYDLAFQLAFQVQEGFSGQLSMLKQQTWLKGYLRARYGSVSSNLMQLWEMLVLLVYDFKNNHRTSPTTSIIEQLPSLNPHKVLHVKLQPSIPHYDTCRLKKLWLDFYEEFKTIKNPSEGLIYDLTDITRQVLSDHAIKIYRKILDARFSKKAEAFLSAKTQFLELISDLDEILCSSPHLLLGTWVEAAKSWASTEDEKKAYEYNARNLITLWGPTGNIRDYSKRPWCDLYGSFYKRRWDIFLSRIPYVSEATVIKEIYRFEQQWNRETGLFQTEPEGNISEIVERATVKYSGCEKDDKWLGPYPGYLSGCVEGFCGDFTSLKEAKTWCEKNVKCYGITAWMRTYTVRSGDSLNKSPNNEVSYIKIINEQWWMYQDFANRVDL